MDKINFRIEKDSIGEREVPGEAYYGIQTLRASENFNVSGNRIPDVFIKTLALIKETAAASNAELGLLETEKADAIIKAAKEIESGGLLEQFILDVYQTGSGTSTNMNMNEVLSNRANEILGSKKGTKHPVHPNDHVNLGQSSNDIIPTAMHITLIKLLREKLFPSLYLTLKAIEQKEQEFKGIVKIGRTHLQDAVPMYLSQEFSGYRAQIEKRIKNLEAVENILSELPLGGTAIGTGINTDRRFAGKVIELINKKTGYSLYEARNHFEAQAAKEGVVELSNALKALAISLTKIVEDIRIMGSGPRAGFGEIILPAVQPGSSIMPGKVNPVMEESVLQVAARVMGNDLTVSIAAASGRFELNVMMPLIIDTIIESIELLANSVTGFVEKSLLGIKTNEKKIKEYIENSLALATSLTPVIGYDRAAEIAKKAYIEDKSILDVAKKEKVLPEEELKTLLDPLKMIKKED
ncbi:MAG: class II fumarate hydratase [Acidobacteria bacterium]|nr:class II fumarate hydratase [Acidobacteriota bacterium]